MSFRVKRVRAFLARVFKPTKKKIIFAVILVLAVILAVVFWPKKAKATNAGVSGVRTVSLSKTTLQESITVTGTVKSTSVANVTTALTYPVAEVPVKVGDMVQAGDVICRLDTADLDKELAKKQESLSDSIKTAQRNYANAQDSLTAANDKLSTAYDTYTAASTALETARNTQYLDAYASIQSYQTAYDAALLAEQQAGAALNADTAVVSAQAAVDAAQTALTAAQAALKTDPTSTAAQAAVTAAQSNLTAAQSNLTAAQTSAQDLVKKYNDAVTARKSAESALTTAKTNSGYDALFKAYQAADTAWLQAKSAYESAQNAQKSAQNNLATAKTNLDNASTNDDIETLQEKIENCTITATQAGTITTLNATVGATANSTTIAVIQDVSHLKVSVSVDEDDVKKVSVGQSATILSDATGTAKISGTVSQLSQTSGSTTTSTAAQQSTSSSTSATFGAEVTVNSTDSGLLVGMSAKVEIVLSESDDVYAVPYDAVSTDASGSSVIYARKSSSDSFEAIPVTTGMQTTYYVEISGSGLSDGLQVRVSANDAATASSSSASSKSSKSSSSSQGGLNFNMGGGNMGGGGGAPTGGGPGGGGPQGG